MSALTVTRTPLRVSFFGGGTDLPGYYREHGGRVLSFGIDRYVYVMVKRSWDSGLTVRCGDAEQVPTIHDVTHPIVRAALTLTGHTGGLEIISSSDVPATGSGLGSSSAFAVGLLHALVATHGRVPPPAKLAELACHLEIEVLGEPIGKQDQYATAMGACHEFAFHPDGQVTADPVSLTPPVAHHLSSHALMFFTGRSRRATDVLADQKERIAATAEHLHALKEMVAAGRRHLVAGDMAGLGALMDAGWETKKKLSDRIHNHHINSAYRAAREAGAYGGKLLGAGGGGFLFFLCPPEHHGAVRAALSGLRETPFRLSAPGTMLLVGQPDQPAGTAPELVGR